jgi:lysophospholipase L1-like esterase
MTKKHVLGSILATGLISLSTLAVAHEPCAIDLLEIPDHEATLPAEEFHGWVDARWYGKKFLDRAEPEESMKKYVETMSTDEKNRTRLIFIGDSITAAWRYEENIDAFDRHFGQYNPQNLAIGADTTHGVLRRIEEGNLDGFNPEVVVILIGVNNIAWGPQHTVLQTANGILKVVQIVHQKMPDARILLMGLLPRGNDDFTGSFRWQKGIEVNTVLETNIDNEQLFYLYIGDQLIEENGDVKDAVFLDGVHLSSAGLDVWAEYMKPKLEKLFDGESKSLNHK